MISDNVGGHWPLTEGKGLNVHPDKKDIIDPEDEDLNYDKKEEINDTPDTEELKISEKRRVSMVRKISSMILKIRNDQSFSF